MSTFDRLCCCQRVANSARYCTRLPPKPTHQFHSSAFANKMAKPKNLPKPFLNSKAHRFRLKDGYMLTDKEFRRGRYGFVIGPTMLAIVFYFGYVREYGEYDRSIMEFLTKDITDKLPAHQAAHIKQNLEEERQILEVQEQKSKTR